MTFCKEMSSRVEEHFCKNICFLGIDTKVLFRFVHAFDSPQSFDSCFGYFQDLLQVVSVTTFTAICFHFVHVLSCSTFVFLICI